MTALAEAECALPIARRNCFVVAGIYMTRLSARAWLEIAPAFRRFGSRSSATGGKRLPPGKREFPPPKEFSDAVDSAQFYKESRC